MRGSLLSIGQLVGLVAMVLAFAGCNNGNRCAGHPHQDCRLDAPGPDGAGTCASDTACTMMGLGVCDTSKGTCVQCTTGESAACTGASPVCSSDDTCRGCAKHAECASDACLPDGSCGTDANVAYVNPTGTDNTTCTKAMPCTKVAKALATGRPYVKLTGTTDEQVTINDQAVTLLAEPGAKLTSTSNGVLLQLTGASTVAIYDLEISGGSGPGNPGISIPPGSTSKLSLARAKVLNNAGAGISASGGSLTVTQSTISGNTGGGISVSGGALAVTQSTISGNTGGGIAITGTGSTFDITNNFIVRNGDSSTATVGGVSLIPAAGSTSRFEFNTVVDNQIQNSSVLAAGVFCDKSGFTGPNNIIARNYVNNDATKTNSNTSGLCTYPTSTTAANVMSLAFASPDNAPFDYHLTAASTAVDQATTASTVTVDIDGDARPQGAADDQGADEYKP